MKFYLAQVACFSLLCSPLMQAQLKAADTKTAKPAISDIALSSQGSLKGMAVNGQGEPLAGAKVFVSRDNQVVATAVTTAEGRFVVQGLTTGIYDLRAGQGGGAVRAWQGNTAPPTAKHNVLIVSGATTRAQSGLFIDPIDTITLGLAITGVALGAAALSKDNTETIRIVSP